jgi:hypothetical protein
MSTTERLDVEESENLVALEELEGRYFSWLELVPRIETI